MNKIVEFWYLYSKKIVISFIFVVVGVLLFVCVYFFNTMKTQADKILEESEMEEIFQESKNEEEVLILPKIKVDIKGAVKKPGVYEVEKESNTRVIDVIRLAGGLNNNSDTSNINLSKKISDEMVIVVYTKDEVKNFADTLKKEALAEEGCKNDQKIINQACVDNSIKEDTNKEVNDSNKIVNINTATKEELMTLSGVGESKAKAIIEYREKNGLFSSIEEIMKVSGIGNSVFEKIKDNITI